jgi:outer membrane protein assembly factor BamE (lipoprotein component of BamABCDE complex)
MRRGGRIGLRTGVAGAALLAVLAACEPVVTTHGYAPTEARLEEVVVGVDTAGSVASKIGRPSTSGVIREDAWYYVFSRVETLAWNAPEVTERRVIVLRFDEEGVVSAIDRYGLEEGRVINLVTRTTPTFGRELSALQQIFGNLGNVGATTVEQLADE